MEDMQIIYLIKGYYPEYIRMTRTQQQQKTNNPIKTWVKNLHRHFFKEDI